MNTRSFDLEHIAALARLRITPDEADGLRNDLNNILNFISVLNNVDVSGVDPQTRVGDCIRDVRPDNAVEQPLRDALIANAPQHVNNLIKVPAVLPDEGTR